jgi:nucleoside-diphosphate-sugar epimerase
MTSCLITGATGFVSGHRAEACVRRGFGVRALVRPGSDTALLEKKHVALIRGDRADSGSVRGAVDGVAVVFHCAARVGDWGPVDDSCAANVEVRPVRRPLDG